MQPNRTVRLNLPFCAVLFFALPLLRGEQIPVTDLSRLELKNVAAQPATHLGMRSLKLTEKSGNTGEALATIKGLTFHNGSIDLDVAGAPSNTAGEQARGFIGVAFRLQDGGARYENIYIRPTNGRADDQLRRNHSTQYVSFPDWPWERLRKETPGVYESYADMAAGEWTHLRIVVHQTSASLYVGGAGQPCLIVHDLKLGDSEGLVALWVGPGTEGYFRGLTISNEGDKPAPYGANPAAGHFAQTQKAGGQKGDKAIVLGMLERASQPLLECPEARRQRNLMSAANRSTCSPT
jgi:hypothetical protein